MRRFDPAVDNWDDIYWDKFIERRLRHFPGGDMGELLIKQRQERQDLFVRQEAERTTMGAVDKKGRIDDSRS